jgi:hypothetical protein
MIRMMMDNNLSLCVLSEGSANGSLAQAPGPYVYLITITLIPIGRGRLTGILMGAKNMT